jgi:hypothetical protein
VEISDPATAHFTAHKNLGNTRVAYKPRHTHTHILKTLEARKFQETISDAATHKPKHAKGARNTNIKYKKTPNGTQNIAYRSNDTAFWKLILLQSSGENILRGTIQY